MTVEVGAPFCLTWITISVTAWASLALEGAWGGTVVFCGDAGTVSSISSSAASSQSEEGTAWHRGCDAEDGALPREMGLSRASTGGNSMLELHPEGASVALPSGRTSPSGMSGLGRLPQNLSWNAFHQWSRSSSCTGTLWWKVTSLSFLYVLPASFHCPSLPRVRPQVNVPFLPTLLL